MKQQQQWLVRFQDKTYVLNVCNHSENDDTLEKDILEALSSQIAWPVQRLEVLQAPQAPFCSVRVISSLRGGKGGFGTLLKGQSKQAGAKRTSDFGACRDLQGRRLRHVNDEIKLRKWREIQRRKQQGLSGGEEAMWKTPSGLYNWHLMVPNWASDSLSKKGTRKMQRQMERELQRFQTEEEKAQQKRKEQEQRYQQSVTDYVRQAAEAAETIAVQDAIQQGLAAKKRKQEILEEERDEKKSILVTLSGDFVVDETGPAGWQLQSKSEFGTMALVLDKAPETDASMYFEVKVVSGGLAQVGWADLSDFAPDTDSGDGVGDLGSSYAYDGSRCLKFYSGTEEDYGESWKEGDVIGCKYNVSTGSISFSVNGKELGDAFTIDKPRPLVPALSCNGGEILELHVHHDQMKFRPVDCVPVFDLLTADTLMDENVSKDAEDKETTYVPQAASVAAKDESNETSVQPPKKKKQKSAPVATEPLDLDQYVSVAQLEELGMDRLKGALMAIGVKCGGSLQERAARLWSLKRLKREDYPAKVRAKNFKV